MSSRSIKKVDINLEKRKMKKMWVKRFDEKTEQSIEAVLTPVDDAVPSRN